MNISKLNEKMIKEATTQGLIEILEKGSIDIYIGNQIVLEILKRLVFKTNRIWVEMDEE